MTSSNSALSLFPNAYWIWKRSPLRDERDRRMQFRRTFELDAVPAAVEINITADSFYTLWVNGQHVNQGTARGFQRHWPFDRIDLAPYLQPGKNVLAVLAYQYGISNYSYTHEWASGFLMAGTAETVNLGTGPDWNFREAPGYIRAVARGSGQYSFQEFFDCRSGDDGWQSTDYDERNWSPVTVAEQRIPGCMPWHEFEERGIPLLTNTLLKPRKRIAISRHLPASDWQTIQPIGQIYDREQAVWEVAPAEADSIVCEPGLTAQLIDFGQEVMGHLQFTAETDKSGEMLDFMICESISGVTPDFPVFEGNPVTLFGGRLILKAGVNHHELTMPWGFRYLVLLRRGSASVRVSVSVRQTIYPLAVTGAFHCSNERLNAIWRMSEHTQRCCMVDAYIDCPWRENAQWWGDALVQSQNTFRLSSDTRLFERGLRQIAYQKTPNGLTYAMAPTCGHNCILPDYSAMFIVTLLAHYWQTGQPSLWLELRETADGILNYFKEQAAETGLVPYDARYWLFLDWCPSLHKQGTPTVLNLIYLWALQSAQQLAEVTSDRERVSQYNSEIRRLSCAIVTRLYSSATRMLYDGLTPDGKTVQTMSPHAAALAILLNLLPEAHETWLNSILLPFLRGHREEKLLPSSYFMYYIFEAVKRKGYRLEVIDCIRRWWGEFLDADCSTTPENWLELLRRGDMSMCHAWSAHPLVHFSEILLGVRPTAPGWRKVSFDPLTTLGQKASGTVPTPYGVIRVVWDWSGPELVKSIDLPPGVQLEAANS